MNLHKTKIEWATHTWNPVTGCRHGCEYCYARRFIARFAPHVCERPEPEPLEFLPNWWMRPRPMCEAPLTPRALPLLTTPTP